jgi:two-component sensor histidine kinase
MPPREGNVRTKPARSDADRLNALARIVLRPRPVSHKILLVLLGLAIAGGGRWLFDQGAYGVPFLTFYPVVVLAALFLGADYALFASVAALLVIHFLLNTGSWNQAEGPVRFAMLVVLSITLGVMITTGHFMRLVLFDNLRHLRQARAYNAELQHRAKNAQQMLRALIGRGPAPGEDPAEFHAKLLGRVEALGRANELLGFGALEQASLADVVTSAIAPFDPGRFECAGPDGRLGKTAAIPLAMALHELGTNAIKYGALSAGGRVRVGWRQEGHGRYVLEWRELGGPAITAPTTHGMGSRLLRPHGGLARVELDWATAGLVCRMDLIGAEGDHGA